MPYKSIKDLPASVTRGLDETKQRQFLHVWNGAYSRCKAKGGSDGTCEAFAFKNANGVVKGSDPSVEDVHTLGPVERKLRRAPPVSDDETEVNDAAQQQGETVRHNLLDLAGRSATDDQTFLLFVEVPEETRRAAAEGTLPDWIPLLPTPGTYSHPAYGEIEITVERNRQFADNVNAQVYQDRLPVDAEHQLSLSGAYAWMDSARLNADGSVDGHVDKWLDTGRQFVESGAFRYTSAEWRNEWRHPATRVVHENVLIGAALTTRPFFKNTGGGPGLRALVASDRGLGVEDDRIGAGESVSLFFGAFAPIATESEEESMRHNARYHEPDKGGGAGGAASSDVVTVQQFTELKTALDAATRQLSESATKMAEQAGTIGTLQTAVTTLSEQNATLSKTITDQASDAQTKRFTDLVMGAPGTASEGLRWLGPVDGHVAILKTLAAGEGGTDNPLFKQYVETQKASAEAMRLSGAFTAAGIANATGRGATGAQGNLAQKAAELRVADPKMTEAMAMSEAARRYPDLYAAYRREHNQRSARASAGIE